MGNWEKGRNQRLGFSDAMEFILSERSLVCVTFIYSKSSGDHVLKTWFLSCAQELFHILCKLCAADITFTFTFHYTYACGRCFFTKWLKVLLAPAVCIRSIHMFPWNQTYMLAFSYFYGCFGINCWICFILYLSRRPSVQIECRSWLHRLLSGLRAFASPKVDGIHFHLLF